MIKLFYSPGACSFAPHIVLEEIGAPFEPVPVHLRQGEHLKPEYLAINPRALVPALAEGGRVLTEAPAILAYLARRHPEARLMPADPWEEGEALSWMSFLSSSVHIAFATIWRAPRFAEDESAHRALETTGRATVTRHFLDIEGRMEGRIWALSDYSVVDPYLLVMYRWGLRIGMPMADLYPHWTRHAIRMQERPAVQRAMRREGIAIAP